MLYRKVHFSTPVGENKQAAADKRNDRSWARFPIAAVCDGALAEQQCDSAPVSPYPPRVYSGVRSRALISLLLFTGECGERAHRCNREASTRYVFPAPHKPYPSGVHRHQCGAWRKAHCVHIGNGSSGCSLIESGPGIHFPLDQLQLWVSFVLTVFTIVPQNC